MPGWIVLEHIQNHHPALVSRFAFMTGGAFTDAAREQLQDTAVPILSKPLSRSDILALLPAAGATLEGIIISDSAAQSG